MGWLKSIFGNRIEPDSVPALPVTAFPVGFVTLPWPRKAVGRFVYTTDPRRAEDVAAVHRVFVNAMSDPEFGRFCVGHEFTRFTELCQRVPKHLSDGMAVWVRDCGFRLRDLPRDYESETYYPYRLNFESARRVRMMERPADTEAERARQRLTRARSKRAVPVRAALIQANRSLFAPGDNDNPGLVLFSFDDRVSDEELCEVVEQVSALKNTSPSERDQKFVAQLTTDERFIYYGRERLPRSFAGRREIFVAHLWFHRPFLAAGYLAGEQILPCLAEPGERGMMELLPHHSAL